MSDENALGPEVWDMRAKGMSGLEYRWGGSHTVNIYNAEMGVEVDMFMFGNFARNYETPDNFLAAVQSHERAIERATS
jgi:hypothetical protein